jgi:amidase
MLWSGKDRGEAVNKHPYDELGVVETAALVRAGAADPVEITQRALARIAALDPALGAIVAVDPQGALAQAAGVRRDLPLAGVPILIKDINLDVAGFPTRYGSRFFEDAPVATTDSEFVRRLRAAGMVILGKSKTPEFAGDFVTEPTALGPARNPWNTGRATGGSSGGSAAAVASFMVPVAHGTDCGGSIRVPAACCGVVGLKPTRGRTPSGPGAGERVGGLNAEGVLTRTVRDTAALLDAVAGPEAGAPYQTLPPAGGWMNALPPLTTRLRVGVVTCREDGTEVDAEISRAVGDTVDLLRGLGHAIVPFKWPNLVEAGDAAAVLWHGEIAEAIEFRRAALGRDPRADEIESLSRHAWDATRRRSALDYINAKAALNRVTRRFVSAFEPIDVLVLPTTGEMTPPIGGFGMGPAGFDYDEWTSAAYRFGAFTELFNVTGQPAISIPARLSTDRLPIGVQLVARFGEDALLLSLAQSLERELRWCEWRPPHGIGGGA